MIRYAALSLLLVITAFELHRIFQLPWPKWQVTMAVSTVLIILMLVFDGYLTGLPIVEYNKNLVLGWHIGPIPLEDFGYLTVVIILGPSLFEYFIHHEKSRKK